MKNPLHYALIVGIDRYPGLPGFDLTSPSRDADAFQKWLCQESGGGLTAENVCVVRASTPGEDRSEPAAALPNRQSIDLALLDLERRVERVVAGVDDRWAMTRLYLYWSGHGILPSRAGHDDRPRAALRTADTVEDTPGAHVDLAGYLAYLAKRAAFYEVVAFADCCRTLEDIEPQGPALRHPKGPERTVVTLAGYAADADDPAFASKCDLDQHGTRSFFTSALLDVLGDWSRLRAGAPEAHAAGLLRNVMPGRMQGKLPAHRRQIPVFYSNHAADLDFGPGQGSAPCGVVLGLPEGAREVVLSDGGLNPIFRWKVAPATAEMSLPRGNYSLTVAGSSDGLRNDGLFQVTEEGCVVSF